MAESDFKSSYPFAGSFFSANPPTSPALPFRFTPYSSIVLHLNGQMETFCAHAHGVLIRNNTDREKAQLLSYYRELKRLVENMGRLMSAANTT